jgi:hypothetical protein
MLDLFRKLQSLVVVNWGIYCHYIYKNARKKLSNIAVLLVRFMGWKGRKQKGLGHVIS